MLRKRSYGGKKESSFKYKGKRVSFAELDGPFSSGIGRKGIEQGEYVIAMYDARDNELGFLSFSSYRGAAKKLGDLESRGVEVSSMTSG